MNSRKLWSVIITVGAIVAFYSAERPAMPNRSASVLAADGTAPLPPLPKPDMDRGASLFIADGTAPLPPLPPPKGPPLG